MTKKGLLLSLLRTMTNEKVITFPGEKRVTLSVATPGDISLSDSIVYT